MLCKCGCGKETYIPKWNNKKLGWIKDAPLSFVRGHHARGEGGYRNNVINPSGLCQCGCGAVTPLAKKTSQGRGWIKGKPIRFIHLHQYRLHGNKSLRWNGGTSIKDGRMMIYMPEHPRAEKNGYVRRYILTIEQETGVLVPNNVDVHHINGDITDDRYENLLVMAKSDHGRLHSIAYHNEKRSCAAR